MLLERVVPGIAALAWGQPGRPLAVLVHGFPDTAWTWRHLGPDLARRGWYAVAPFTRGYAPSSLADGYDIGGLVADVVAVRDRLTDGEPATLVGHDWGGAIVSGVAASAPDGFASAAILAIPPLPAIAAHWLRPNPRRLARLLRQAPRSWYMAYFQVPGLAERTGVFDTLWRAWAPGYDSTADRALLHTSLNTLARRRAAITYYRAVANPLYRRKADPYTSRRAFGRPQLPTLYLHGDQDRCGRADLGSEALAYLPPGSQRVIVPGAGHFLHLENPTTVNELICSWLDRTRPADRDTPAEEK
ncbi:alpha/beta fold hydrolase [Nocardia terpenica]|nr:alpha/beta fold hydrolase [Nocardia terpenica]